MDAKATKELQEHVLEYLELRKTGSPLAERYAKSKLGKTEEGRFIHRYIMMITDGFFDLAKSFVRNELPKMLLDERKE